MKNNKKMTLKTKDEKRRLAFEKRNVKKEKNFARYGAKSGPVLVMEKATDINRRFIAVFLALVFAISAIIVGVNFATKAEENNFDMLEATNDSGLVMRKGIRHNNGGTEDDPSDDTYDLRMEAYATQNLARKAMDENTPLDIVMVLPQGTSMAETDVLKGYKASAGSSFTINDAKGKYVLDDGVYYPLSVDNDVYAVVHDTNGVPINPWTAQTAYNWETNNRDLYFYDGTSYLAVNESKDKTYSTTTNSLNFKDPPRQAPWSYSALGPNQFVTDYYVYVPHEDGNIDDNKTCWHRVYISEQGVAIGGSITGSSLGGHTTGGYYFTVYYYTNSIENPDSNKEATFSSSDANKKRGDVTGSGTQQVTLLSDFEEFGVAWGLRGYHTIENLAGVFVNNTSNGTDGNLYTRSSSNSNTYNVLYTGSSSSPSYLACQNPGPAGSHDYNGNLYTKGYRLYYTKNGQPHYIGDPVMNETDVAIRNGTLYEEDLISRQDALKSAASQFAEQVAQSASNELDHRIAVVGYADNGSILPSSTTAENALVKVTDNDASDNGVNDTIDDAINGLTAAGGNNLAAGLSTAGNIFAENSIDNTERKRVVVVFTDADAGTPDNALTASNALKDDYNATVYAVRLYNSEPDEAVETFMHKLSSEYFYDTETGDGTYYYRAKDAYTDENLPVFDIEPLANAFSSVADALQPALLTTTLGASKAVLKDIITKDFIVPQDPNYGFIKAYTVSVDTIDQESGEIEWSTTESPFTLDINNRIVTPNNDGTTSIEVKGFDYSSNYVSASRDNVSDGKKFVVEISGLTLKDNVETESDRRIYSNTANSGLYKKGAEDLLFAAFPRPYVDKTSNLVPNGSSGIPNDGAVVNKYLTANENGNYDLTLEAYSTSKNETATTTEKIPTDFVVVVDQSGSMEEADMPTGTATKRNNVNLETVADGAYYYYDEAADQYYKVYGVKDYLYRYYPANYWFTGDIVEHLGADIGWFMGETDATTYIDNAFYFREVVGGKTYYLPIKTTIEGKIGTYYMRFSYPSKKTGSTYEFNREVTTYSSNGNSPWYKNVLNGNVMTSGALWATANAAVQTLYPNDNAYTYSTINLGLTKPRTGMYVNYPMYGRHLSYTKLCYRDVNGVEHVLPSNQNNGQTTWEFCDNDGQAITSQSSSTHPTYSNLYTFDKNIRRIDALQSALNEFARTVANEQDDFGPVDNKISIVGFSSLDSDSYNYDNTELLTGSTFDIIQGDSIPSNRGYSADGYNHNGKAMTEATDEDYAGALVNATNGTVGKVNTEITDAINALTAYGGTQPENGLAMANSIIEARNQTGKNKYTIQSGDHPGDEVDRNTVVIFFTDGQPGDYHTSDQYEEANEVVAAAKTIKDKGASIFSIGVFGESDGNPLTYTHATRTNLEGEDKAWKYLGGWMESYHDPYYPYSWYCLRRQWRPSNDNYTATANDTIYDYMSVTSSNYPDAENFIDPRWLNGTFPNDSYIHATDGVDGNTVRHKSTAEKTNKYYRMASNQATLVEAFLQAITMNSQAIEGNGSLGPTTILRDILKDGTFKAGTNPSITVETVKGKADRNGVVTFENVRTPISLQTSSGDGQYEVTGFDYTVNSIYYGKPKDTENGLEESQGRKLVVTIKNVVPNETITSGENNDKLFSNEEGSGLVKNNAIKAAFPKPAITRHSYTMDVGDANKNASFEVTTTLVAGDGASADLSDVILVKPDGSRVPYTEIRNETFSMANRNTFYFENVPQGYSVQTSLKAPDSFFTYSFWTNNDETKKETLSTKKATTRTLGYSDNVLHVTSVSSYRTVTIAESVSGDYANESDVFDVNLTLTPPEGDPFDEDTITLANGVVLEKKHNGKYEGTITGLPGNQEEKVLKVPANWTLNVDPVKHDRYDVDTGYPKYNTNVDPTQTSIGDDGVVISNELTNIFINNISKEITVEGIFNSKSHNWIIYLLVGIAAIAVISGGIFLWKKKDEFVEE